MSRGKYLSLTVKRKLEIIDQVESLPPGKKDVVSDFRSSRALSAVFLRIKKRCVPPMSMVSMAVIKRNAAAIQVDLKSMLLYSSGLQLQERNQYQLVERF